MVLSATIQENRNIVTRPIVQLIDVKNVVAHDNQDIVFRKIRITNKIKPNHRQ